MATAESRAKPSGIAAEIAKKIQSNRDPEVEKAAAEWLAAISGEPFPAGSFEDALRDGVLLCKVINKISPNSVKKIAPGKSQTFLVLQNIESFTKAAEAYGLGKEDLFQTVDLYDKKNIPSVTKTIYALARVAAAKGWSGPHLAPPAVQARNTFASE